MRVVAFVPIKLNSQRLPNKNILPIKEKPMCWHICNSLSRVEGIDETLVFCSDASVKKYIPPNVAVLERDRYLDGDEIKGFELYDSFIKKVDADIYVLAHTTSPFLKSKSIAEGLSKVVREGYDSAFTVKRVQTFAWYQGRPVNYSLTDVIRTQDIEPIFVETSGIYIFKKEIFTNNRRRIGNKPYLIELNDIEAIDIDTQEDYDFAAKV